MKKLVSLLFMFVAAVILVINISSCSKEDPVPLPTVRLLADVDGYDVLLTVEATDVVTYAWDYGNGETSMEAGTHTYTYPASGDYTITVTVSNESGSAFATAGITINPSIQEMLAGVDAAGKTWVLSKTPSANDGAGPLHPSEWSITLPFALVPDADALAYVGFPDEYDNEFTFKPDGSYAVNNGNGQNLCTQIFAFIATNGAAPGDGWTKGELGFATMSWEIESNATWAVEENASIALEVMSDDPATATEYTPLSVSYEDVTRLIITGGYFGILDVTNYVIVENIAPDKMQAIIIMHTELPDKQSIFARITMVPK